MNIDKQMRIPQVSLRRFLLAGAIWLLFAPVLRAAPQAREDTSWQALVDKMARHARDGELSEACQTARDALNVARVRGDDLRRATALFNMGRLLQLKGKAEVDTEGCIEGGADPYEKALEHYLEAENTFDRQGNHRLRVRAVLMRAEIHENRDETEPFAAALEEAIRITREHLDPADEWLIVWHRQLAKVYLTAGDVSKSRFHVGEAVRQIERTHGQDAPELVEVLRFEARLLEENADTRDALKEALDSYQQILRLRLASPETSLTSFGEAFLDVGRLRCLREGPEKAREDLERGLEFLEESGTRFPAGALGVVTGIADVLLKGGDLESSDRRFQDELEDLWGEIAVQHLSLSEEECSARAAERRLAQEVYSKYRKARGATRVDNLFAAEDLGQDWSKIAEGRSFDKDKFQGQIYCGEAICRLDEFLETTREVEAPLVAAVPSAVRTRSSGGGHDHQVLGNILADYAQEKADKAKDHAKANRDKINKHYKNRLDPTYPGSWNIPPLAMALRYILLEEDKAKKDLIAYCQDQLGDAGLWGKEILSWLYWEPPAIMALVRNAAEERKDDDLAEVAGRLVEAHLLTLALFSQRVSGHENELVWSPGIRTSIHNPGNLGNSYFLASATQRGVKVPVNPDQDWAWPWRIADGVDFGFLDEDLVELLRRHMQNGREAGEIVRRLQDLHVKFQAPVRVWRYASGDSCALIERNTHGNKPPVLAVSIVYGEYHLLHGEEGGGWKCERQGDRIVATKGPKERSIPAPDPDQELRYEVEIGRQGVILRE